MGETPDKMDSFERAYAELKRNEQIPLAESSIAQKNEIIADFLSRRFNQNATIPADHYGRETMFGAYKKIDIDESIIRKNNENLDDHNPKEALENKTDKPYVLNKAIENSTSLKGLDRATAKAIENQTISETELKEKFPLADSNIVKAAAYTLLNTQNAAANDGEIDTNLRDMAITHLQYAHKDNPSYDQWIASKQDEITKTITQSPEIMRDLKSLKCPQDIETTEQLEDQFTIRQRLAENLTNVYGKAYGVNDTFNQNDSHIVFKSREDLLKDPTNAYLSSNIPGTQNDETLIYRYNPAFQMSTKNVASYAQTDQEEAQLFLNSMNEELQHGIDNILADKLVLGTLNQPEAEQHALSYTLNKLFYIDPKIELPTHSADRKHYNQSIEKYADQYVEKTAKDTAEKVTSAVMANYDKDIPETTVSVNDTLPPTEQPSLLDRIFKL
ncbi:MAG: hypothetical protein ACRBDI_10245 [Alphaproteobacteria bacterium]